MPAVARPGESASGEAERAPVPLNAGLLAGLRVVDFSAFVAGPLAAEVLADLGADVIKVEPPAGEAMRAAAYAVAACQRGKRSVALDIGAPEARPVVEKLLREADVVLHNFRVGVAERLRIDAATVAELNPRAVYCHASAFGSTGRRAKFPGNDALMEAVTGTERAIGGDGNDPIAATWIPIDTELGFSAAEVTALLDAKVAVQAAQLRSCHHDVVLRDVKRFPCRLRRVLVVRQRWYSWHRRYSWHRLRDYPAVTAMARSGQLAAAFST